MKKVIALNAKYPNKFKLGDTIVKHSDTSLKTISCPKDTQITPEGTYEITKYRLKITTPNTSFISELMDYYKKGYIFRATEDIYENLENYGISAPNPKYPTSSNPEYEMRASVMRGLATTYINTSSNPLIALTFLRSKHYFCIINPIGLKGHTYQESHVRESIVLIKDRVPSENIINVYKISPSCGIPIELKIKETLNNGSSRESTHTIEIKDLNFKPSQEKEPLVKRRRFQEESWDGTDDFNRPQYE